MDQTSHIGENTMGAHGGHGHGHGHHHKLESADDVVPWLAGILALGPLAFPILPALLPILIPILATDNPVSQALEHELNKRKHDPVAHALLKMVHHHKAHNPPRHASIAGAEHPHLDRTRESLRVAIGAIKAGTQPEALTALTNAVAFLHGANPARPEMAKAIEEAITLLEMGAFDRASEQARNVIATIKDAQSRPQPRQSSVGYTAPHQELTQMFTQRDLDLAEMLHNGLTRGDRRAIAVFHELQSACAEDDMDACRQYLALRHINDRDGGREFDMGRTIFDNLLDSAKGFANMIPPPFGTIAGTVLNVASGISAAAQHGHSHPAAVAGQQAQAQLQAVQHAANNPDHPDHDAAVRAQADINRMRGVLAAFQRSVEPLHIENARLAGELAKTKAQHYGMSGSWFTPAVGAYGRSLRYRN